MSWLNSQKLLCIGHRGAMGHEPENTLLSIKKAITLGVDLIEIDVHRVGDQLLVIHDPSVTRTTNGIGAIAKKSFSDLRALDAGKGQQIPILEEVFDLVNRQVGINIELKGKQTAALVVELIHRYLNYGWSYDDFLISSFNYDELQQVQALDSQINLGLLLYRIPLDYLQIAHKLKVVVIINSSKFINYELVNSIHQQNLKVWSYTVNRPKDIALMKQLNIDGIITNYPERV
ncbi:MAG TPA: glycerophosphodiester phosphodiesterase [Xenococcaceae cyanobacterium]